jgi:peptide/nickel transport system substrate-binding protein
MSSASGRAFRSGRSLISRRRFVRGSGVAAAGLVLGTACTASETPPTPVPVAPTAPLAATAGAVASPTPATRPPKYGGTFSFPFNFDTPHLDPHQTSTLLMHVWGPGVAYSRLVQFKAGPGVPNGSAIAVGDLAESWTQPDETTYVFKIRPGVKWHNLPPVNGRELVAQDIVYSFQRIMDLKVNAGFLGPITKMEAPDRSTVRIQIARPDIEFPAVTGTGQNKVVAREAVEQKGDLKEGPTIGTGPWVLEKWEPNVATTFRRNPDYFQKGLPYADRLEYPRIQDDQTRLAAFRAGNLSHAGVGIPASDIEALRKQVPTAQFVPYRVPAISFEVMMNSKTGPTADKRVRQAIAKAIDVPQIINTVLGDAGILMTHFTLPALDYILPEDELKRLYARDLAASKRLLSESGNAGGLDLEMFVLQQGAPLVSMGELVAAQLLEAGIRTKITLIDNVTNTERVITRGDYTIAVGTSAPLGLTNQDLFNRFHSTGTRKGMTLNDPKSDEMIEKQSVMKDAAQRKQALLELQRYLMTEALPSVPLNGQGGTDVRAGEVRDLTIGLPAPAAADAYPYVWLDK